MTSQGKTFSNPSKNRPLKQKKKVSSIQNINRRCQRSVSALRNQREKSFFLESSICITVQQSYRGEKGWDKMFFSDSNCSKMQCSHSLGLYLLFVALKYSALCDVLLCTLINSAQYISTASPITFLDWKHNWLSMYVYTIESSCRC